MNQEKFPTNGGSPEQSPISPELQKSIEDPMDFKPFQDYLYQQFCDRFRSEFGKDPTPEDWEKEKEALRKASI